MGSTLNITAGAVGSRAKARNTKIGTVNQGHPETELTDELAQLLAAMRKEPNSPEKVVAEENVQKAALAATEGKQGLMTAYLRAGGHWALGVAEKIGVALVAAEIKDSLGIK